MKNIIFSLLTCATFISCKKDDIPAELNRSMPIELVKVNQRQTEVSRTPGSTPSVVLVSGFGSDLKSWQKLYNILEPNTTVFIYNRGGTGLSENVPGVRDARTIAMEMKTVLDASNIKPPYVLVAHSMGGMYARMFHHLHPGSVKGIVLVDATHENQLDSLLSLIPASERDQARAGLAAANENAMNSMPEGSMKEEFRANFATNYEQIRAYPAISNIPLYVITSTRTSDENPPVVVDVQKALHQQWATAAGSNGRFVETSKSGHYIQLEEPGLVKEGIRWILSR